MVVAASQEVGMNLGSFFSPKVVAVIGVSSDPDKVGYGVFRNMLGYRGGTVYGVNPKATEILGRQIFPDLESLPEPPELVVVCIPAKAIPDCMRRCVRLGVKGAVVISAGFKETGEAGRVLEQEVASIARSGGIEIVGPNVLGILGPANGLNASFAADLPAASDIAMISQSGALCTGMLDWASSNHVGFSKVISMGNKADLDENDFIEALADDPETSVMIGYLESINEGGRFIQTVRRVARKKPVILLKAGNSQAGAQAASSHTGSMAGATVAYDCAFRIAGVTRARGIEDLFDLAQAFSYQPLPSGRRTAVITNAGGAGILCADAVEEKNMVFAVLEDATKEQLRSFLPAAANVNNPVDVLGDAPADRYRKTLAVVGRDPGVDCLVVLLSPQSMTDPVAIAREIIEASHTLGKPVMASFLGDHNIREAVGLLQENRVPHYPSPERAVEALRCMAEYREWRDRPERVIRRVPANINKVKKIIKNYRQRGQLKITEQDAKAVFQAYGFGIPEGFLATTAEQAVTAAERLGYPVVMKVVSQDVVHKSDAGGVRVGVKSPREVEDAFDLMMLRIPRRVPGARVDGVLVEEMRAGGREVILGMTRDPQFGPMLMFGLGGIYVEVMKDVAFHLAPLTQEEAMEMLAGTKTYKLLTGVRGQQGVDIDAVAIGLQRIAQLVVDFPEIQELDINPLSVGFKRGDTVALDARIALIPLSK
jgi:acetyltransferase